MHTGLLSRADADRLSIEDITNRIGLRELERDPCNEHIAHRGFRKLFALCNDVCKIITRHGAVIAALLHAHAEDLTHFGRVRFVGRVNLNHSIFALLLFLENLQGFRIISRCDHTIGDFSADKLRGGDIHSIGQSNEITKGGHPVHAAGAGVGCGERRKLHIIHK